jgi:hypothetical protein
LKKCKFLIFIHYLSYLDNGKFSDNVILCGKYLIMYPTILLGFDLSVTWWRPLKTWFDHTQRFALTWVSRVAALSLLSVRRVVTSFSSGAVKSERNPSRLSLFYTVTEKCRYTYIIIG